MTMPTSRRRATDAAAAASLLAAAAFQLFVDDTARVLPLLRTGAFLGRRLAAQPRFYGNLSLANAAKMVESSMRRKGIEAEAATSKIPKTIYIFWETGWDTAHKAAQLARGTCRDMNPGYQFVALNGTSADELVDRSTYIPDDVWHKITVQARSDILRTMILERHGGIWTDASLFCSVPFDMWLEQLEPDGDLITFRRHDKDAVGIDPWITSWFLAAPRGSYTVQKNWDVITDPAEFYRFQKEYFWWHRIVAELADSDERIDRRIRTVFPSANPMHCINDHGFDYHLAPVFKRCNFKEMSQAYQRSVHCCENSNSQLSGEQELSVGSATCEDFDCENFFDLPLEFRARPPRSSEGKEAHEEWEGNLATKVVDPVASSSTLKTVGMSYDPAAFK